MMKPFPCNGEYESNVFINCPFDEDYRPLLRPLLFTIIYLGFNPRIALERSDSAESRINKICELIGCSQFSIHDLSRLRATRRKEFFRLNMPFELGVDYGARTFGSKSMGYKRCLILAEERYEYMKAISDISGVDIKVHKAEPDEIVRSVRNWFVETVGLRNVSSPTAIWYKFNEFASDFYDARISEGFSENDVNTLPMAEYVDFIRNWVTAT